jgi:hypothetical protein
MSSSLLGVRIALVAALATATPAAWSDELLDKLHAIPGLAVVAELPTSTGGRFFRLTYEQPVNHLKPWKGTFTERAALYHQGETLPMVFYSGGYYYSPNPFRAEPTRLLESNQLNIEHRFFLPSRPDPADWSDLTIFQQASDDHRLEKALKSIYQGPWLRTGASKGGMQATYHKKFYPSDVDGLIAYVAPNDVIDSNDHYADFLANVGTDPECRASLAEVQRQALLRRDEIVPMVVDYVGGPEFWEHTFGSADKAFEMLVLEMPFTFWQFTGQDFCSAVPLADASNQEIFDFLDLVQSFFFWIDEGVLDFEPYYYQAGTQLAYPRVADEHLAGLLRYPGADVPRSFVSPEIAMPPFQWWAMPDIDFYVRFIGRKEMFIYGETDPWGAERFELSPFSQDSYVYEAPMTNHSANIAQLTPEDAAAATATLRRWAGLPPATPAELEALRKPPREPDLDQLDRFRWRRRDRLLDTVRVR